MDYVNIGKVVSTHALKGELKIKILTDFPETRFKAKQQVVLKYNGQNINLVILKARQVKDLYYCTFANYEDINLVEQWIGSYLLFPKENSDPDNEDEAFYHEIMHSKVYNNDDKFLGEVSDIIESGKNIVIRVSNEKGNFLVPFNNVFILHFKKKDKKITINEMEGLY